jgi:hypothetical protein
MRAGQLPVDEQVAHFRATLHHGRRSRGDTRKGFIEADYA